MPARKPRPKRADVERLRDGMIASYDKVGQQRLETPPTPQAVARRTEWVARRAWDVALCQAWLGETEQARVWPARAATHYHELSALPLRADDPDVRTQSLGIATVIDAMHALHCLALGGSSAQRQDCAPLPQRFNEPQTISIDYMPIHRLYVCTLRDLMAGDEAGCRHWAEQASQLRRVGKKWAYLVQGVVACRAIVAGEAETLAAALQVVLREQLRNARGEFRGQPEGLLSLQGTALVALALERGVAVDLDVPNGEYIARCFLPTPG